MIPPSVGKTICPTCRIDAYRNIHRTRRTRRINRTNCRTRRTRTELTGLP